MLKTCKRCKEAKELDQFNRDSKSKDDKCSQCRQCFAEMYRLRKKFTPGGDKTKFCSRCERTLPAPFFNLSTTDKSGLQSYCRSCFAGYQRDKTYAYHGSRQRRIRFRKRDFVHAHKTALGCADCGERHVACLEFHHIDPSLKSENISGMINKNRTVARITAEMAKCVVICRNCHAKRHYDEKQQKEAAA